MVNCDKCKLQCVTSVYDQLRFTIRKMCLKIKMHSIIELQLLQEMDDGTIDDAVSIKSIFLNLICGY